LWLAGRYFDHSLAYQGGLNLMVIMAPMAIYFGFSTVSWRVKRLNDRIRKWVAILLVILGIVLLPSALIFLALVGLFDALLDYRKLISGKGENP
jgi:uncharacterized membrane protein YhaH (DUF805 family)